MERPEAQPDETEYLVGRPRSITVIASFMIIVSSLALVRIVPNIIPYMFRYMFRLGPMPMEALLLFSTSLVYIVSSIAMLKGFSKGRLVFLLITPVSLLIRLLIRIVISFSLLIRTVISWRQFMHGFIPRFGFWQIMPIAIYIMFFEFLTSPSASEFFSRRNSKG